MKVSACLIVKDEEHWLPGLFENLQSFVDEWIIVDTGSTDATRKIAESQGAKVVSFEWTGDFSEARNFSLDQATQDWVFVIDPDERIDPEDLLKIKKLSEAQPDVKAFHFETRNYTRTFETAGFIPCQGEYPSLEKDHPGYFVIRRIRLFQNDPKVRYKGRLHESVYDCFDHSADGQTVIHHYGHLPEEYERKKKAELYLKTALEKTEEEAFDAEAWYQLGLEWIRQKQYTKSEKALKHAHRLGPGAHTYSQLGACIFQQGRLEEAVDFLKEGLSKHPQDHDIILNLSSALITEENFLEAFALLKKSLDWFPKSIFILRLLGFSSMRLNDAASARSYLERSLEICPQYSESQVDLAILDWHEKKTDQAKERVESVLKADPQHPRALALQGQLPF